MLGEERSKTLTIEIGVDTFISSESIEESLKRIEEIAATARRDIFAGSIAGARDRLFKRLIEIHTELGNILRSQNFIKAEG